MSYVANSSSNENKPIVVFKPLTNGEANLSAPVYNVLSIQSFNTLVASTNVQSPSTTQTPVNGTESHAVTYVLIFLGILLIIAAIISLAVYLVKRNKLDRIRHHLMPLYNFDPTDEEPHWEADLLEDDRDQQMVLNITSSTNQPKLKFHMHGRDI